MYLKNRTAVSTDDYQYRLVAVVQHIGGLNGGHYIAHVLHAPTDEWYTYDDEKVIPTSRQKVATVEAYLLFYDKVIKKVGSVSYVNLQRWANMSCLM